MKYLYVFSTTFIEGISKLVEKERRDNAESGRMRAKSYP